MDQTNRENLIQLKRLGMQSAFRSIEVKQRKAKLEAIRQAREKSDKRNSLQVKPEDLLVHDATSPETLKSLLQLRLTANEKKNAAMMRMGMKRMSMEHRQRIELNE